MSRMPILPLLLFSSLGCAQTAPPTIPLDVQNAMHELRKEPFRADMAFLADDLLEGRGTGKRGHEIAARYVAAQFEALALKPGGKDGTFFQRVPLKETTLDADHCAVELTGDGRVAHLTWGNDFIIFRGHVGAEDNAAVDAPLVFAGYGVRTPDGTYDDYAGLDVKGKIAVLLTGAPPSLSSELGAHLSAGLQKLRIARDHGAIGILVLWSPKEDKSYAWSTMARDANTPSMSWLDPGGLPGSAFPQIRISAFLSPSASEKLFANAPKSWDAVLRDADASRPQGFALPLMAHLQVASHHTTITSPNVVAVLPGSDPRLSEQYVVYSAHVDHLGIGKPVNGDSIYNGAVDDASGVAALLGIARAFKALPHPPARSILFLATTAEEEGLLGSDYFAHFPTVPTDNIVADINMDGASMFYTFNDIVPLGAADSTLDAVVARNAARLGLRVSPDPDPSQDYFVRADQYSFVRQGVPSLFISEGNQARDPKFNAKKFGEDWGATRYHMPSDDMNQPLNFDAPVEFMQIDFLIGYDIAQDPERPRWKPGDFFGETFGRK
jgi:hypothetical protein